MDFKKLIDENMDLIKIGLLTVVIQFVIALILGAVIGVGVLILPFLALIFWLIALIIDILVCPFAYYISLKISGAPISFDFTKILVFSIICYLVSQVLSKIIPGLSTIFGLLYPFFAVLLTNKDLIKK